MENSNIIETALVDTALDDDVSTQCNSIDNLLLKLKELEDEKQRMREEFGHQRAKMKDLYLQKDEECRNLTTEKSQLVNEVKKLNSELDEAKSQILVEGYKLENNFDTEKRKYEEELASLRRVLQETVDESAHSREEYEHKIKELLHEKRNLEMEIEDLQTEKQYSAPDSSSSKESSLAPGTVLSVTKSIARNVFNQLVEPSTSIQENLEQSKQKAEQDCEALRSIVIPLEEEIVLLKQLVLEKDDKLRKYEDGVATEICPKCCATQHVSAKSMTDNIEKISSPAKTSSSDNAVNTQDSETNVSQSVEDSQSDSLTTSKVNVMNTSVTSIPSVNEANGNIGHLKQSAESGFQDGKISSARCDMCLNYEAQLVQAQKRTDALGKEMLGLEQLCDRYKEDLAKESMYHKEMEEKWNEKKEELKSQVAELKSSVTSSEKVLHDVRQTYSQTYSEVKDTLSRLTKEIESLQQQLIKQQTENDKLVGKTIAQSQKLQNEVINLPNSVDELQELLLKTREELIQALVGKEVKEEEEETLRCEINLLREQMAAEQAGHENMEDSLSTELNAIKVKLAHVEKDRRSLQISVHDFRQLTERNAEVIDELKSQLDEAQKSKLQLEKTVGELKSQVASLQQELNTSERVQRDFVHLSQSLQIELEGLRGRETEVRWQHEDDVDDCSKCRASFSITRKKQHCRHCGRIFCHNCLSHTVLSGPNKRPSKVCDLCHTMLVSDAAPFFSSDPPVPSE